MSKEKAAEFLNRLKSDEQLAVHLKGRKNPNDAEEMCRVCSEIAAEYGENISAEDFLEVLRDREKELRQRTDKEVSGLTALKDHDLEDVAGGGTRYLWENKWYDGCRHTQDGWCVAHDACNNNFLLYLCDESWSDSECSLFHYCSGFFSTYNGNDVTSGRGDDRSDISADAVSADFKESRITGADFF